MLWNEQPYSRVRLTLWTKYIFIYFPTNHINYVLRRIHCILRNFLILSSFLSLKIFVEVDCLYLYPYILRNFQSIFKQTRFKTLSSILIHIFESWRLITDNYVLSFVFSFISMHIFRWWYLIFYLEIICDEKFHFLCFMMKFSLCEW